MDFISTLKKLAPTVAAAALGPLGGVAIQAVGELLGISDVTRDKVAEALQSGAMSAEQLGKIKELEMKYKADEREFGFKYAELAFKDRDSARQNNTAGGTQKMLFGLSLALLTVTLGCEVGVLFYGVPSGASELVVGRILGLMDSVALMVLAYHYGSSAGSERKTSLLTQAAN